MATITAQIPDEMAAELTEIAEAEGRSKSWIIKEAMAEYIVKQHDLRQMTLEGLADLRAGKVVSHEEIIKDLEQWGSK